MWSQGFEFSESEPSTLTQRFGGPCGVLAPVQAHILKSLLAETMGSNFNDLTSEKCKALLVQALCCILTKCKTTNYYIVTLKDVNKSTGCSTSIASEQEQDLRLTLDDELDPTTFHNLLVIIEMRDIEHVRQFYLDHFHKLESRYGVLLFLYAVLLTKGLQNILNELCGAAEESLIHSAFGHASQALINLMLTGRCVPYVFDNDKNIGGLTLRGINQQSDIGFLTVMEQMQYCTVGSFYKNPRYPIWVLGSETHLTVLFSPEKKLAASETPREAAIRVFQQFNVDGANFIESGQLQEVLRQLDLVSVPEYVDIMRKKLDPENLGIILMNAFLEEFFEEESPRFPDIFDLYHYNGIPNSNLHNQVKYRKGTAVILETNLMAMSDLSNPMLTCLQTKWPNIEVNWIDGLPSLN